MRTSPVYTQMHLYKLMSYCKYRQNSQICQAPPYSIREVYQGLSQDIVVYHWECSNFLIGNIII